jgi:CIC family chloride channel protein
MFFSQMFPSLAPNPAAFVMVGMTGFFAGIAHAPISTIIMVSEMTGNYRLLVPAMWVSAITFTVAGRWSLYREQVPGSRESGAHRGEFARAVFDDELVGEHMVTTIETVRDHELLGHALNRIASGTHRRFPVVDEIGRPIGLFKRSYSLRFETQERPIRDVMTTPVARLIPGQTLGEAASQLANPDIGLVVVIDPQNDQLVGVLSRGDLLRVYQHRVHEESRTNLGNAVALAKEVPDPAPRFPAGR